MKLLIINNLSSGYREGAIYDFIRSFVQDGDEICLRSTDGTTDLRKLIYDAALYDAVVVSGGDGTIATISYLLAGTGIPLCPFPAGTANLLCLNLKSPNEPHALADMVRSMKTMDFDLGEISFGGRIMGFNLVAGAGYDALLMKTAESSKALLGQLAYFTAAAAHITPQTSHFVVHLDDKVIESDGVGVLLVNFPNIQFDIPLAHESNPQDGLMEVAILKSENALGLIPALGAAILDRNREFPARSSAIEIHQAKSVSVLADPPMKIQFDGDPVELTTPLSARILPKAARYIVCDDALKEYQARMESKTE